MLAYPPITQTVRASKTAFSGRFASTAVQDVALSSEPTAALRASVGSTEAAKDVVARVGRIDPST
jgi:hypothetical protein